MGKQDPNFYITEICYKSKSPVFIHYGYNKTFQVTSTWITWSMGHFHLIVLFLARQPKCTQSFWTPTRHPGQLLISLFPPRLWSQPQTCWDQVLVASFQRSEFKLIHKYKSQPFYMFWLGRMFNHQNCPTALTLSVCRNCWLYCAYCLLVLVGFGWFSLILLILILVDFCLFWLVLVNFGLFWLVLVSFGWFWLILVGFDLFWIGLEGDSVSKVEIFAS